MRWSGKVGTLFLLPAVIWVLVFTIFPLGYSLFLSLVHVDSKVEVTGREEIIVVDDQGNPILKPNGEARTRVEVTRELNRTYTWNGFANYTRAFNDNQVTDAAGFTAIFVVTGVLIELFLGLLLAYLFNRPIVGRGFMRSIMILPIFATPIAIGYLFFTVFYEEGGPLQWTGLPWLSDPIMAKISVILVDIWQWTPFCFLVFLAALQGISEEQIESARLDSNSQWDLWKAVILPALKPIIIIVGLLRLAEALKLFDIIATLTKGGPGTATQSYTYYAYTAGFKLQDYGYASALAFLLLIVVMVIVTFFFRFLRQNYE